MKLSINQENLSRALTAVSRVASNKAGLPILSNILLRTDGNLLIVAATNLEIASSFKLGTKVVKQGSITIPARLASEFIASLPKGTVELEAKNNHLTISSGKYQSIINGIEADDFPELPTIDDKQAVSYSLDVAEFKQAVSQTVITASSDSTRPVLTGVYWHAHEGFLYLAATDGYRLSERKLIKTKSELSSIVPASNMQEVLRTIYDDVESIEILFDDTQVLFRLGEAEITSRLIDGAYPDYRQLIPKESDTNIKMNSAEFTRVVKIASLFARESGGSVTLTADSAKKELSIHSIASEYGENTSEVDAEVSGDGVVTLNSRYLGEALSVTEGSEILFRFSGKLSPCILTSTQKDANYQHIIMPLKS